VRADGPQIRLLSAPGATAEGIAVVREISRMVGGADMVQSDRHPGREKARSFGDFAVLFRTGRQAEVLEECFAQEGLPYHLSGQKGFLQAASVGAALAFCRYLRQPGDGLCLLQVLELEAFDPGKAALAWIRSRAGAMSAAELAEGLPAAAAGKLEALETARSRYNHLARAGGPAVLLRGWQEEYGPADDVDLEHLIRLAEEASSLEHLLDVVLLGLEADFERAGGRNGRPAEAVRLMTLHAAKGLEFPVVFICGVEDGLIPLREREADVEEERRLFYVGLTRAREEVVLLHARSRSRYGQVVRPAVAPFIAEIPAPLISREELRPPRPREQTQQLSLF
jgi:superfamily I DNA/RNA helicase